jgi:hypothetical protein
MNLRKWAVAITIAILFTIFVNATIEAIYKSPEYNDFCRTAYYDKPYVEPVIVKQANFTCPSFTDVSEDEKNKCIDAKGMVDYKRDVNSCPTAYKCEMCNAYFQDSQKMYNLIVFIISAILGIIAIVVGIMLPSKNPLNEWIGMGFMIGGLFTIFVGTIRAYSDIDRFYRPFVMLAELILVIFLAYRQFSNKKSNKNKNSKK